jgi:hypothetical protein
MDDLYLDGGQPIGVATCDTQIGLDIPNLSAATTNIGIRNGSTLVNSPATQALAGNGDTIAANATLKVLTSTAALTMSSTPTVANGQDGQFLILLNGGSNDITLQDKSQLNSSNLHLGAPSRLLTPASSLVLVFASALGSWVEVGFTSAH